MSIKHQETFKRIFENPIPKDIRWSELISLLKYLGGNVIEGQGSRIKIAFNHVPLFIHKPHPGNELKVYVIKKVRIFLIERGLKP